VGTGKTKKSTSLLGPPKVLEAEGGRFVKEIANFKSDQKAYKVCQVRDTETRKGGPSYPELQHVGSSRNKGGAQKKRNAPGQYENFGGVEAIPERHGKVGLGPWGSPSLRYALERILRISIKREFIYFSKGCQTFGADQLTPGRNKEPRRGYLKSIVSIRTSTHRGVNFSRPNTRKGDHMNGKSIQRGRPWHREKVL